MYDNSDPRSGLVQPAVKIAPGAFSASSYVKFYESAAAEQTPGLQQWYARGQNFVLAYSELKANAAAGELLKRCGQADEYVVLLPDTDSQAEIITSTERVLVNGFSLIIVPPGDSEIVMRTAGRIVRLFTVQATDLLAKCANEKHYDVPNPRVAPLEPWPAPPSGYKVRSYSLDVPPTQGRFGRIFRCTTFMINYLDPSNGPRDPTKMSPHHHDDFEQGSLALAGSFTHHLRWPWTTNMTNWRDDEHELCGTPSLAIIPAPAIHTTEAKGAGVNQLVDIFCGPRMDFSQQNGWVLNADEYPLPA